MSCKSQETESNGTASLCSRHLLKRQFQADAPMHKLVTDITYLPFGGKTLYLSSILDLFNGEVVASTIADKQDTAFVLDTLNQLPAVPGAYSIAIRAVSTHHRHIRKL